ncbi:MAG: hypothetical protein JHD16_05285 [Solirubrobacteraceae bacterium]|nr:hypothetical protein [Solirubrobacteraceae bacterium]
MRATTRTLRLLVAPLAIAATLSFAACGDGGIDEGKLEEVQKQGEQIQKDAQELQKDAQQISEDVQSGKKTGAEAQAEIEKKAKAIEEKAKGAASDSIDAVKDNSYLSESDKQQLEDAQAELAK